MRTFDTSLFELYNEGVISFDEAIQQCRLGQRAAPEHQAQRPRATGDALSLAAEPAKKDDAEAA